MLPVKFSSILPSELNYQYYFDYEHGGGESGLLIKILLLLEIVTSWDTAKLHLNSLELIKKGSSLFN